LASRKRISLIFITIQNTHFWIERDIHNLFLYQSINIIIHSLFDFNHILTSSYFEGNYQNDRQQTIIIYYILSLTH
jgi:hypothetical protein